MNKSIITKVSMFAFVVMSSMSLMTATELPVQHDENVTTQPEQSQAPRFNTDFDLIKHAVESVDKEVSNRSGNPYTVSCVYKMTNGNVPASVSTKIYFSDYRKEPASVHTNFVVSQAPEIERIVEVVYKFNKKSQVSLVDWDPKKESRRLSRRQVKI